MKLKILLLLLLLTPTVAIFSRDKNRDSKMNLKEGITKFKESIVDAERKFFGKHDWLQELVVEKDLLYDKYTLKDTYKYKKTTRQFQWDKIYRCLAMVDSMQALPANWGVLQNRHNKNGKGPLVKDPGKNDYNQLTDKFGVEQDEGIPLFLVNNHETPERYALDGTLVRAKKDSTDFFNASTVYYSGDWLIKPKYIKFLNDTVVFNKVIVVDRTNQNITTVEKVGEKWLIRSMNPATTGLHNPPLMKETPLGLFVIQEKKPKMQYLDDAGEEISGFAPNASRFCNGAYIHGVPVNAPREKTIEYSSTLGTTPRSHMCVRNATSHAEFVYNWAPIGASLVFVIE